MQNRAVIQSAKAQEAEQLRHGGRHEAGRQLSRTPIMDDMVKNLLDDQRWELEEEVRELMSRQATERIHAPQARQGGADDSRPTGR